MPALSSPHQVRKKPAMNSRRAQMSCGSEDDSPSGFSPAELVLPEVAGSHSELAVLD
jgi:hypothetical protein